MFDYNQLVNMSDQQILEYFNMIVDMANSDNESEKSTNVPSEKKGNNENEVKDSDETPSLKNKKTKKCKRCKNCRKKSKGFSMSCLSDCKYCSLQFCMKCSSPYDHNCSNLEKRKIEEKARLRASLMSGDSNFSKIDRL